MKHRVYEVVVVVVTLVAVVTVVVVAVVTLIVVVVVTELILRGDDFTKTSVTKEFLFCVLSSSCSTKRIIFCLWYKTQRQKIITTKNKG